MAPAAAVARTRPGSPHAAVVEDRPGLPAPTDAFAGAPVLFVAYDAAGVITYAGGAGWAPLGVDPAALTGTSVHETYGRQAEVRAGVERCLTGETDDRVVTYGGRVWDLHSRPTRDADGRVSGGLCMAQDVTSWSLPPAGAEHDRLTGVLSQAALQRRLAEGRTTAAVVVDVEAFRAVNDACGRAGGDRVLVEVARRLSRTAEADGARWEVGRWSGDVFALLSEQDGADPESLGLAVAEAVGAPFDVGDRALHLSVTVACALSPPVPPVRLVLHALLRVREEKVASRLPAPARPSRPRTPERDDVDVAAELRTALTAGQLLLHFQPVVRLSDARPVGLEALVRWQHPERGLLRPAEFLPAAERSGLVVPLGERVLREACHVAGGWARRYPDAHLRVAVNLTGAQLLQPGGAVVVREALRTADCPPRALLLEVSDAAVANDADAAARALDALRLLGVGLALDDVGTGWSSSSYLTRLPVDVLKIDRSFVSELGSDPDAGDVVAALVSMSRRAGLTCLAEGIETAEQLATLRRLGCELGQGYVFSRPLDVDAATAWLDRALRPARPPAEAPGPVEASTLERALALQAQGASLHTVAARLNLEGLRTARGRRWHHTSVAQLLAAQADRD